jgi:SAM-dependent methyltransferase
MKLTDPTDGLRQTALQQVSLRGDSVHDLADFWDEAARADTVRSIADQDDETTFETSGLRDAQDLLPILPEQAVVLEIGSGVGRIMQHLSGVAAEVHGVDVSEEMVERGSKRLAHLGNVHFHKGNGYDLATFADGTFDVVFSWVVFQHMPKTVAYNYLTEVRRVLKPRGRLLLEVPNILRGDHFQAFLHFSQPWYAEHPYPMNFYSPHELVRMLLAAGLMADRIDDRIVAIAHRPGPDECAAMDEWQQLSILPEVEPALGRIRLLEGALEQAQRDVARMRPTYEHPVVRAARRVGRSARMLRQAARRAVERQRDSQSSLG